MTKIIKSKMYCEKCEKYFEVPVFLSTNSFMLERDPELRQRYEDGTLFKNFCPECKKELIYKKEEK